ncbi:Protein of unknown function [Gryllus bimaculatus]|nr:uncharacterized protein GBIM_10267 [Gryllus bimaculatus]GLH04587.1 Protein of unknown function [Gryllus bimaculatus]
MAVWLWCVQVLMVPYVLLMLSNCRDDLVNKCGRCVLRRCAVCAQVACGFAHPAPGRRRSANHGGARLSERSFCGKVQSNDFGNYSCVADNNLGKARQHLQLSGVPNTAEFGSNPLGRYTERYNLTWSVVSFSPIEEFKLMYRKLPRQPPHGEKLQSQPQSNPKRAGRKRVRLLLRARDRFLWRWGYMSVALSLILNDRLVVLSGCAVCGCCKRLRFAVKRQRDVVALGYT